MRIATPKHDARTPGIAAGALAAAIALSLAGCSEEEPRVHEAPEGVETITEADPTEAQQRESREQTTGAPPEQTAAPAERPWTTPDAWTESDDVPAMRLATLVIDDESGPVEVAISRFGGDVGGMLANVNRWRGQVGLDPVTEAELPDMVEEFSSPGFEGSLLHIEGESQHMLVASLYETGADRTWFVRVTAEPEVAARVKDEVFDFARSFSVNGG